MQILGPARMNNVWKAIKQTQTGVEWICVLFDGDISFDPVLLCEADFFLCSIMEQGAGKNHIIAVFVERR